MAEAISQETKDRVRELHNEGKSMREIAVALGWGVHGKNRVSGIAHRLRVRGLIQERGTPIGSGSKPRPISLARSLVIAEKLRAGDSIRKVASDLRISRDVIRDIRDAHGIEEHKCGPAPGYRPSYALPRPAVPSALPPEPAEPASAVVLFLPPRRVQPVIVRSERQCVFLTGDEKPWSPCPERAVMGYSYCEEHCRTSYVNWIDKRSA